MSSRFRAALASVFIAALAASLPAAADAQCAGDCNDDFAVDDGDLAVVVNAIFDPEPTLICPDLVLQGTPARASELVQAVINTANACIANTAPAIPAHDVYRSYSGYEIALPIAAEDPDGPLTYSADQLPEGALLEPDTGILRWMPSQDQIGPFYVPFRVTDSGLPPATTEGTLALRITPLDSCSIPSCDPASGCTSTLPPLTEPCCSQGPVARVAEVLFDCPEGRVLMVGRNHGVGFGRMQNCDKLRLQKVTQAGVSVIVHIAARCFKVNELVRLHALIESPLGLHTARIETIILRPTNSGFDQRLNLRLPMVGTMPEIEGMEANVTLTLEDPFGDLEVSETLRLLLTHTPIPDLPDVLPMVSPPRSPTPTPPAG